MSLLLKLKYLDNKIEQQITPFQIVLASPKLTSKFWSHFKRDSKPNEIMGTPCLLWTGAHSIQNYGNYNFHHSLINKNIQIKSHRLSFFLQKGKIPSGLVIHHKCEVKLCGEISHLDCITNVKNVQLSNISQAKKRTHCIRRHGYTKENTHYRKDGNKECKKCQSIRSKNLYNKKKLNDPKGYEKVLKKNKERSKKKISGEKTK